MYAILVYDVVTDAQGKKILPKIFKICKKYLNHIQNSVFEGELSSANAFALRKELDKYIRKDLDSVIIFHTRENRWMTKEFWGMTDDKTSNFL